MIALGAAALSSCRPTTPNGGGKRRDWKCVETLVNLLSLCGSARRSGIVRS